MKTDACTNLIAVSQTVWWYLIESVEVTGQNYIDVNCSCLFQHLIIAVRVDIDVFQEITHDNLAAIQSNHSKLMNFCLLDSIEQD